MEEATAASSKRSRDDDVEGGLSESKRMRAALFDFLDDESEPDNTDLDSVMRSLEEEISLPVAVSDSDPVEVSDPDPVEVSDPEPNHPDLGFLLMASDDELGLPPAEAAEGEVISGEVTGGEEAGGPEAEAVGFGKIWGLDDPIHLDFGFASEGEVNEGDYGGVIFDGLFDYDGGACGPADFSDLTRRPGFLSAV